MTQRDEPRDATDALLLVLVVAANLLQNLAVPERWQFVSQPACAALAVALVVRSGATLPELGLDRRQVGRGLRWGLAAVAVIGAVLAVLCALPAVRTHLDDPAVGAYTTAQLLYETLLRIPIATAGPEEVLFRGAVLAVAVRRWGWRIGAIASAALFGLWHIAPTLNDGDFASVWEAAGAVAGAVLFTFAAGLVFAWLRHRSGSLLAPFLAHWAANALALTAVHLVSH